MRTLIRSVKLRSSRSLYARDILRPGAVFGSIAQRAALALRRAPHRTREREMRLADALGSLARNGANTTEREVHMAQRQSGDIREASVL